MTREMTKQSSWVGKSSSLASGSDSFSTCVAGFIVFVGVLLHAPFVLTEVQLKLATHSAESLSAMTFDRSSGCG